MYCHDLSRAIFKIQFILAGKILYTGRKGELIKSVEKLKKPVGRPSTDEAHKVRTKAWFIAVSMASGMNVGELEIYFAPPEKQAGYSPGNRPRHWEKYRDGSICPKSKTRKNQKRSIVERVEDCFPGTAKWVELPFWKVLSKARMEMHELKDFYQLLPVSVQELIVMNEPPLPPSDGKKAKKYLKEEAKAGNTAICSSSSTTSRRKPFFSAHRIKPHTPSSATAT
jgi:hypothetical protein